MKSFVEIFGCGPTLFDTHLKDMALELFDISSEEFYSLHWVRNNDKKTSTRKWISPSANALNKDWIKNRDMNALYSHPDYKWDSLNGSLFDTSATVAKLINWADRNEVSPKTILDYGAGPGITSIILAASFPEATVSYYEINKDSIRMNEWLRERFNIHNIETIYKIDKRYEMVCMFEVIEHISKNPFEEVKRVLNYSNKEDLFVYSTLWSAEANGWMSLGHFKYYLFDKWYHITDNPGRGVEIMLSRLGWKKIARLFNNRPHVFRLVDDPMFTKELF